LIGTATTATLETAIGALVPDAPFDAGIATDPPAGAVATGAAILAAAGALAADGALALDAPVRAATGDEAAGVEAVTWGGGGGSADGSQNMAK
jgi:hypothetical protein